MLEETPGIVECGTMTSMILGGINFINIYAPHNSNFFSSSQNSNQFIDLFLHEPTNKSKTKDKECYAHCLQKDVQNLYLHQIKPTLAEGKNFTKRRG